MAIYCPEDLPDHNVVNCEDYFAGGISEFVIFNSNATTTDYTSGTEVQSDIDAGRATLVTDIIGEMTEPADKIINHPRDNKEITQGFEFSMSWIDWNYTVDNVNFYDDLNFHVATAMLFYEPLLDGVGRCKLVSDVNNGISFKCKAIVPTADTEFQNYTCTSMWVSKFHPSIVDLPTGIFDQ